VKITRKDATITNTGGAEDFPGTFEVILSAPTLDRDGDTLLPEDWQQPLPDHITFDQDHGMSVESTVGSGVPTIDPETGNLIVRGTYSSLQRAQDVRTLVNEGHIRTTSVAFMNVPGTEKDGKGRTVRELLNGAFVAIPSNREALVLDSKGVKAGARNSAADAEHLQAIHDHAAACGAACPGGAPAEGGKALAAALAAARKDAVPTEDDPAALIAAIDAAVDAGLALFADVAPEDLAPEAQQAVGLFQAADAAADSLMAALGIPDPDDEAAAPEAAPETGAEKSAPVSGADAKAAADAVLVEALAMEFATAFAAFE
jgi:hypothetical protein